MAEKLPSGYTMRTVMGATVKIVKHLGEGGQGDVYLVDYTLGGSTESKALKWYKPGGFGSKPEAFYENIKNNVMKGSPSKEFLWPTDITPWIDGLFGYIMDVRAEGFYEISQYMLRHQEFASFRVAIDACLNIVSAFRQLHNKGFSYQDLNDGNFFINPRNGKVLICDNDNVAPDKYVSGVLGKQRYMAPEIVMGKSMPDKRTDFYSMSVILFIILCMGHPLEGKKWLDPAMTYEKQQKLYGSEALFIMDKNDKSNAPDPRIQKNPLQVFPVLPTYIQDLFYQAFSQEAMLQNPNKRPVEVDWLKALVRFRSDIVFCKCGNEIFSDQGQPCSCEKCGRKADIPYRLEFIEYSIPGINDSRIYKCQLGACRAEEALTPMGRVIAKKDNPGMLGIRNLSKNSWRATTPSGKEKYVKTDEVIPLIDGIKFSIDGETIQIHKN